MKILEIVSSNIIDNPKFTIEMIIMYYFFIYYLILLIKGILRKKFHGEKYTNYNALVSAISVLFFLQIQKIINILPAKFINSWGLIGDYELFTNLIFGIVIIAVLVFVFKVISKMTFTKIYRVKARNTVNTRYSSMHENKRYSYEVKSVDSVGESMYKTEMNLAQDNLIVDFAVLLIVNIYTFLVLGVIYGLIVLAGSIIVGIWLIKDFKKTMNSQVNAKTSNRHSFFVLKN